MLIAAGVNPHTIMHLAGHASYAMTMERYGHQMPGATAEATEQFDRYMARGTEVGQT